MNQKSEKLEAMFQDMEREIEIQEDKEFLDQILPTIETWVTSNHKDFFFALKNVKTVPSGLYTMIASETSGFGISKQNYKSEEFLNLPSLPHMNIVKELNEFWSNRQKFIDYGLNPKRGIILHGDPGCGKSSLIYLLVEELKKQNGICVMFDVPQNWVELAKLIRKVEPKRPLLCIIEHIDLVIERYGEVAFLDFLDGLNSVSDVVYVATTNNINKIPDRIKNRPSRFDKLYEIKKPTAEDRKMYLESKILPADKKKYSIAKLVKDTEGFSMAHLKECFISLYILNNEYKEALERLKKSKLNDSPIGFDVDGDDEP